MAISRTILVIDSRDEEREYWTQRLRISSPEDVVLEAKTGKRGLAIFDAQPVDCVVLELTLEDMSGFEVLINLVPNARRPGIAVVVLTRLVLYSMDGLALTNGAQAYLVKSRCSGDDLDRAIQKAIAKIGPHKSKDNK